MKYYEYMNENESRSLNDGIYDVGDIGYMVVDGETSDNISDDAQKFMDAHPDHVIGSAYQCYAVFLFASPPILLKSLRYGASNPKQTILHFGSGFNHGSANMLRNCPKNILILAEDD